MTTKPTPAEAGLLPDISPGLLQAADLCGDLQRADRAAILLEWLRQGAERELLHLVSAGELSAGKMVELLGITYYDVPALAAKYGLEIGATGEQSRYALEQFAKTPNSGIRFLD